MNIGKLDLFENMSLESFAMKYLFEEKGKYNKI